MDSEEDEMKIGVKNVVKARSYAKMGSCRQRADARTHTPSTGQIAPHARIGHFIILWSGDLRVYTAEVGFVYMPRPLRVMTYLRCVM